MSDMDEPGGNVQQASLATRFALYWTAVETVSTAFQLDRLHVLLGWFPRIEEGLSQRNPLTPSPLLNIPAIICPYLPCFNFEASSNTSTAFEHCRVSPHFAGSQRSTPISKRSRRWHRLEASNNACRYVRSTAIAVRCCLK
jgi:hypothetical protein